MRTLLLAIVLAAGGCGAPGSAAAPDAFQARGAYVGTTHVQSLSGTSTIQIPPTGAGDFVAVIIAREGTATESTHVTIGVQGGVDAGTPAMQPCGAATEVWISGFALGASAGTTDVVIGRDDDAPFDVDVVDFANVTYQHDRQNGPLSGTAPGAATPVGADPGDVVLSTLTTCGTVTGLAPSSPFIALDTADHGTSVAYVIPTEPGTYGAAWSYDGGDWGSFSIAME